MAFRLIPRPDAIPAISTGKSSGFAVCSRPGLGRARAVPVCESQFPGDLIGMAAASVSAQDAQSILLSPRSPTTPNAQQMSQDWVTHRCRVVTCTKFMIDQPPRYMRLINWWTIGTGRPSAQSMGRA